MRVLRAKSGYNAAGGMSLEKKYTLWDGLCRVVQSVFLAVEITVLADLLFAAGENPLPRAAFWGLFLAAAAALSLWRGFTRKGRRIVFLSIAGAAALSALALFAAWSAAAPKTAYEAPETEPKAIFSEKRVLAVVPHEDDDLNLLSGVTGQFTDAGSEVYVVFVSTGDAAGLGEKRVYEAINALSLDGVPEENIIFLGYGDSIPDDGIHIYNAAPNAVTPSLSGRTETHAAPNHEAYREGTPYTRENLLGDLRSVIEEIRADAGLDIGGTLIGMHLKKVAVPVRLEQKHIGQAILLAARTRPKFIGGERAIYDESLKDGYPDFAD